MPYSAKVSLVILTTVICFLDMSSPQLVIYVKNQGGDVFHESISANISDETVLLEFLRPDGVLIMQIIDFANELQLLKAVVPGEEELGQNGVQNLCFLSHSDKTEFISPDAMLKLRQKNPGTVRIAEEDKGSSYTSFDGWISLISSDNISPIIRKHCGEPATLIYANKKHFNKWATRKDLDPKEYASGIQPFPDRSPDENNEEVPHTRCPLVGGMSDSCLCQFSACIIWYPCGLKYCKGKNQSNTAMQSLSYRCGIKTCKKCQLFEYFVKKKAQCLWDQ